MGWVSAGDSEGGTICIVDAHRDNGTRFVVRSDEMLSAFVEVESITHELALSALLVMTVIEIVHRLATAPIRFSHSSRLPQKPSWEAVLNSL